MTNNEYLYSVGDVVRYIGGCDIEDDEQHYPTIGQICMVSAPSTEQWNICIQVNYINWWIPETAFELVNTVKGWEVP